MNFCPCTSGLDYESCCGPYHQGEDPPNALALMRSRYSAYALGKSDYILKTTHPQNVDMKIPLLKRREQIENFSASTEFLKLDILSFEEQGSRAYVTFFAHLSQKGEDVSFKEKSEFENVGGKWLYLSRIT